MGTHSTVLAWEFPRTEEPDGFQSMGSQRAGHNSTKHDAHLGDKATFRAQVGYYKSWNSFYLWGEAEVAIGRGCAERPR